MDRLGYHRNNSNGGRRRYSRSRSRSRERNREANFRRHNSRSRSRERDRMHRRGPSMEKDLYRDLIEEDYIDDRSYNSLRTGGPSGGISGGMGAGNFDGRNANRNNGRNYDRDRRRSRSRSRSRERRKRRSSRDLDFDERDRRDKERDRDREKERERRDNRHGNSVGRHGNGRRYSSSDRDSEDSDHGVSHGILSNTIVVTGLKQHITEADIMSTLIQSKIPVKYIRLMRRRNTGASRGFAFVEFNTVDDATQWMELTQGWLTLPDQSQAQLQYSDVMRTSDWYCVKCGFSNFRRRYNCFKCNSARDDSEKGTSEGIDEVSHILTKKIMLRNLDALTNEESVLMAMQQHAPEMAKQISKVLISRDPLTQTSRGICYLHFETLVDSMNLHNALAALEPPLKIDDREILVSYCMDHENREILPKKMANDALANALGSAASESTVGAGNAAAISQYTLADVPRLADYSASIYASTPVEHAQYLQYYTDYYISEINKGNFGNLPTSTQMSEYSANSGAAVALSAIQRKQKKMDNIETTATQAAQAAAAAAAAAKAALLAAQQQQQVVVTPKGNDGKTYPTPDVSLYQYDETSGYYYDPSTGLYYDAHSQYYYNNETGAYLYWDQRKSTYILATPAAAAASVQDVVRKESEDGSKSIQGTGNNTNDEQKKDKKDNDKPDKVKVAKKIVKDMEKWAKQLNQKKDYTVVATPQPILPSKSEEPVPRAQAFGSSYADVGFSILEKKERAKLSDYLSTTVGTGGATNKLVSTYGSDSDDERPAASSSSMTKPRMNNNSSMAGGGQAEASESDYVDFQKLTCLLCKRAFQSAEILQKHLKMSNLHKENLQKFNMARNALADDSDTNASGGFSYRDRAKERRLKYGESEPPPPNRTRERFEHELKTLASRGAEAAPSRPISSSNVGNRLLQKMGWSEGQGLGRKNQGRTNIIEAEARNPTAGLGTKAGMGPGNDYKTYIKKMMKSRYESV